jgi:hypothetical protein
VTAVICHRILEDGGITHFCVFCFFSVVNAVLLDIKFVACGLARSVVTRVRQSLWPS